MMKFLTKQGTKLISKASGAGMGLSVLAGYARPTLTAAAILATCTTGVAYYYYNKELQSYKKERKDLLKKLDQQFKEERSEYNEFQILIIELKERIKEEKKRFIELQSLDERSFNFSREFDSLDQEFEVESPILSKDTIMKIFEALYYLIKDNIHGYAYARVVKKFREKRRELVKSIRFAFNFHDISQQRYCEYAKVCMVESSVMNQIVIKALSKIMSLINLKKKIFDKSFLILGKTEEGIRNVMRDTFTRLTSSLRSEESEEEMARKGSVDAKLLLEILEYRLKTYPRLTMFNQIDPSFRKATRLKFMADLIFFMYNLEDEDLFVKDPEREGEENELHLNPNLKKIANKIQKLIQSNF